MISNFFIPELNNHDVQELWFQQDDTTRHTARATIDLLKDTFGDRLISRFGPVNWPPRSCDLTTLDYFLWGYVKSLVCADKPQTLDHLEDNICRVIADIRPQMLEKVIENWTSRLDYIRGSRGSPMPEIIFKMGKLIQHDNVLLTARRDTVKGRSTFCPDCDIGLCGVKAGIFWIYFRYATVHLAFSFILGFAAYKAFEIGSNVWLSQWSSDPPLPDGTQDIPLRNLRMGVYGLIGLAQNMGLIFRGSIVLPVWLGSTRARTPGVFPPGQHFANANSD
ncbi:putative LOC100569746 [Trichonephila clavipes]|nr:putative LOC100569746 [Trichonephila clavipes]